MWPFRRKKEVGVLHGDGTRPRKQPWEEPDLHGFQGISAIRRGCLGMILASSRATHPNEFGGFLRVKGGVIEEVILLPGTVSGNEHAIFYTHMLPVDMSIQGTVHSHPSPYPYPSDADLELFAKHGRIHLIAARPYTDKSWRAYTFTGDPVRLDVVE
ncbi:MAG: Mov34/MPN/PAD-1 family protein [Gemmatimonadales bacterium]